MPSIDTIGYEGVAIDEFLDTLVAMGVGVVADVRDFAASRKRDFSKSRLIAHLESVGISYVHFQKLGDPKAGRMAARSGHIDRFREIYRNHIEAPEARKQLGELSVLATKRNICLLCYEREPLNCHRLILAQRLTRRTGKKIRHLGVHGANSRKSAAA